MAKQDHPRRSGALVMRGPVRRPTEDQELLQRRVSADFQATDTWRSLRILGEFVEGFDALAHDLDASTAASSCCVTWSGGVAANAWGASAAAISATTMTWTAPRRRRSGKLFLGHSDGIRLAAAGHIGAPGGRRATTTSSGTVP